MTSHPRLRRAVSTSIVVVSLIGYVSLIVLLGGCQPMVPSPRDPSIKVPADQALTEAETLAKAKQTEKRAAERRFKLAAQKLQAETGIELAELTASFDEVVEKADAEAASIMASTQAAIKAAEDRQAAWMGGLNTVATIATGTGIPGVALAGGLLTGALGLFSAAANKRKAKTEAEARAATEAASARVIDSIDIVKQMFPDVAKVFKDNAPLIAQWQGVGGTQLVNRVQNS